MIDRAAWWRPAVALAVLGVAMAGAVAAAATGDGWGTVAALGVLSLAEGVGSAAWPPTAAAVGRAGLTATVRSGLAAVVVVLLAARSDQPDAVVVGTAVAAVVVMGAYICARSLRLGVARLRRLPLVTRNLDLDAFRMPSAPSRGFTDLGGTGALPGLIAAVGLAATGVGPAAAALAVAAGLAAIPVIAVGADALRLVRSRARQRAVEAATTAVERLAPEVVLYFASTPAEVYQLRMWLDAVERLGRPAAVILRSHAVMAALGDTRLPVICSPYNGTIASLPLPDRVVALFVTHSGNNLSMLRRPESRCVFVGHGDSDKPDSVNPFARVYDEVWVAGPLGRRRYVEAAVGVSDRAVVEVGRPQIRPLDHPAPNPPTIVYAPTWEGWGEDPHHSSLAHVGVALIEALLAHPGIRVRYRPHPLTGRRDPQLRRAHRAIAEQVGMVPPDEPLDVTLAGASALVADVSSVVTEFLGYDRPYAIADTRGLGARAFVRRFPSAAGGVVVGPDLAGLDVLVAAATGGADRKRQVRRRLMADALGDPATSQERFAAAVEGLLRR